MSVGDFERSIILFLFLRPPYPSLVRRNRWCASLFGRTQGLRKLKWCSWGRQLAQAGFEPLSPSLGPSWLLVQWVFIGFSVLNILYGFIFLFSFYFLFYISIFSPCLLILRRGCCQGLSRGRVSRPLAGSVLDLSACSFCLHPLPHGLPALCATGQCVPMLLCLLKHRRQGWPRSNEKCSSTCVEWGNHETDGINGRKSFRAAT